MKGKRLFKEIIIFCLVVLSSLPEFVLTYNRPLVETSTGPVLGIENRDMVTPVPAPAFLGIPYAKPPIGDLRFKKPQPVKPWTEPFDANDFGPACIENKHFKTENVSEPYPWMDVTRVPNISQSEDCLNLNIWLPPPSDQKNLKYPVMMWIHGGDFSDGSARAKYYMGHIIASFSRVIVVTFNYRLGILGFLSSASTEAPGNMGFYDMLEAMKWVKTNIGAFGGSTEHITLFGHGAGSIAVGLMCVSPMAKGLFHRAILQSGSPAYLLNDNRLENDKLAKKVAVNVGCAKNLTKDPFFLKPEKKIECLRRKNARKLVELSNSFNENLPFGFSSVVGDDFMPVDPRTQLNLLNFNDVDIMIGNTQDEGSFLLVQSDFETFGYMGQKNSEVNKTLGTKLIKKFLKYMPITNGKVAQHYLGNLKEDDYDAIREQTYHSMGDYAFFCPDLYFAESFAKKGLNVYAYYFNHVPSWTTWAPWMGSVHFDEVPFVFGSNILSVRHSQRKAYQAEINLSYRTLMPMWKYFAYNRDPGEKTWPKFTINNPYFKEFNISNRTSLLEEHKKNCEFFRPHFGFGLVSTTPDPPKPSTTPNPPKPSTTPDPPKPSTASIG